MTDKMLNEEMKEKAVLETSVHMKEVSMQVSELKNFVENQSSSEGKVVEELKQLRADMEQLRASEQEAQEKAARSREDLHEAQLHLQQQSTKLQDKERALSEVEARCAENAARYKKTQDKLHEEVSEHRQTRLAWDESKRLLSVLQEEREAQEAQTVAKTELAAENATNRENEIESLQRRVRQLTEQVNRSKVREGTLEQQVNLKDREIEELRNQKESEAKELTAEKQVAEDHLTDLGDRYQAWIEEAQREKLHLLEQLDAAAKNEQVAKAREQQYIQEIKTVCEQKCFAEKQLIEAKDAAAQATAATAVAAATAAMAASAAAEAADAAASAPDVEAEPEESPANRCSANRTKTREEILERESRKLRETVQYQKGLLQELATQWRREQLVSKLLTPGEYQSMAKRQACETGAAEIAQLKVRSAGLEGEVTDLRRTLDAARKHGPPQMWVAVEREMAPPAEDEAVSA